MSVAKLLDTFFKEQWIEAQDCEIDFSKHEPTDIRNSLHVYEERYQIGNDTYRLLYAIDSESEPLIEVLKKS
jgi:hypothetical protein